MTPNALPIVMLIVALTGCARRGDGGEPLRAERAAVVSSVPPRKEAMDYFELIRTRHSTRAFLPPPISDAQLESILQAANRAPSAGNLQSYEIVVVSDAKRRAELASACHGQRYVADAPIVLVFLSNPARSADKYGTRGELLFSLQDATIAASYAQLAVHALGLGSVWVGAFDDQAVAHAVQAPDALRPSSLLAIGHRAEQPVETSRRRLDDLVHRERVGRHGRYP